MATAAALLSACTIREPSVAASRDARQPVRGPAIATQPQYGRFLANGYGFGTLSNDPPREIAFDDYPWIGKPCGTIFFPNRCMIKVAVKPPEASKKCAADAVDFTVVNVWGKRKVLLVWEIEQPNPQLSFKQFRFRPRVLSEADRWPIQINGETAEDFDDVESDEAGLPITDKRLAVSRVRRLVVNNRRLVFSYNIDVEYRAREEDDWIECDHLDPVIISRG